MQQTNQASRSRKGVRSTPQQHNGGVAGATARASDSCGASRAAEARAQQAPKKAHLQRKRGQRGWLVRLTRERHGRMRCGIVGHAETRRWQIGVTLLLLRLRCCRRLCCRRLRVGGLRLGGEVVVQHVGRRVLDLQVRHILEQAVGGLGLGGRGLGGLGLGGRGLGGRGLGG
eukprot:1466801-Prymnesium_polylepis.1